MTCEECGFDAASVVPAGAAETVRSFGRRYRAPLTRLLPGEDASVLRTRPEPGVWSALEYTAHMRDVLQLWGWMLHKTLTEDRPVVPRVSEQEVNALVADYGALDPVEVADALAANAERMAAKVEKVTGYGWDRVVVFGEDEMTALDVVRKVAHEGNHHLLDVGRVLRKVRGR